MKWMWWCHSDCIRCEHNYVLIIFCVISFICLPSQSLLKCNLHPVSSLSVSFSLSEQIEYVNNGLLPGKLDSALVLNTADLQHLEKRIEELQQEKIEQRELYKHAKQQHVQLRHDLKDMEARIKGQRQFQTTHLLLVVKCSCKIYYKVCFFTN